MTEFDFEELLCAMLNISDEQRDDDFDIYEVCEEHFDISFDGFCSVAKALLTLTPSAVSPLSGKVYHAFIVNGVALVKTEFK